MSEPKFTPGPWEAVLKNDPRGQPSCMFRGLVALVEQGDRTLAVVLGPGHAYDTIPPEQWEPNARLIAAAPELYEAVRRLVAFADSIEHTPAVCAGDDRCFYCPARAALAKAAR